MFNLAFLTGSPSFLTGSKPFPLIDGWCADAALFARQNLRSRETKTDECLAFLKHFGELSAEESVRTLLSPEVFAYLTSENNTPGWAELCTGLTVRSSRLRDQSLVWSQPSSQFKEMLKRQGKGSRRDSSSNANFIESSKPEFTRYASAIDRALLLLGKVTPGFREEINQLVDCIVLADEGASFRGASGLAFRGMIILSPESSWTDGIIAEELVHETTHQLLDLISLREPLLKGDRAFDVQWAAPFRPDKRPLFGNFHALVVISRLIHLFLAFERYGIEPETDWRARGQNYAMRSVEAFTSLKAYGDLSGIAKRLMEKLVEPTLKTVWTTSSCSITGSVPG